MSQGKAWTIYIERRPLDYLQLANRIEAATPIEAVAELGRRVHAGEHHFPGTPDSLSLWLKTELVLVYALAGNQPIPTLSNPVEIRLTAGRVQAPKLQLVHSRAE